MPDPTPANRAARAASDPHDELNVVVVTWAPGGNLPPLLAAGAVLRGRGHDVEVLASDATRQAAERAGFATVRYAHAAPPDTAVAFERQAGALLDAAAGPEVARDVHDLLAARRPDLAIVDCMLPAAAAAAEAAGTPVASLVHFLYGPARRRMAADGSTMLTDLAGLNATRRMLGLAPLDGGVAAWESCALVLVSAPRWLDVDADFPPHVVHAGPLAAHPPASRPRARPARVLLSFSTTVMDEQAATIRNACAAAARSAAEAVLTLGPAVPRAHVGAPPGVTVLDWADHDELLPGCAACVTHGGLGTTLRALAHGVPLLMLPLGRDQHLNAARVSELGAGLELPRDTGPDEIHAALTELLGDPRFSTAAARLARRMRADLPDARAAAALERAAR